MTSERPPEREPQFSQRLEGELATIQHALQANPPEYFQGLWRELSESDSFGELHESLGRIGTCDVDRIHGALIGLKVAQNLIGSEWDTVISNIIESLLEEVKEPDGTLFDDATIDMLRLKEIALAGWQFKPHMELRQETGFDAFVAGLDESALYAVAATKEAAKMALFEGSGFVLFAVAAAQQEHAPETPTETKSEVDWDGALRNLLDGKYDQ